MAVTKSNHGGMIEEPHSPDERAGEALEPRGATSTISRAEKLRQRRILIEIAGFRVLLVDLFTSQYGHLGYELLMAAQDAERQSAALYAFNSMRSPNPAILRLRSLRCRSLHPYRLLDGLARFLWRRSYIDLSALGDRLSTQYREGRRRYDDLIGAQAAPNDNAGRSAERPKFRWLTALTSRIENRLKRMRLDIQRRLASAAAEKAKRRLDRMFSEPWRFARWPASPRQEWLLPKPPRRLRKGVPQSRSRPGYLARRRIAEGPEFRLGVGDMRRARNLARTLGIADDAPTVCVHVRESGYKVGREIELKGIARHDSVRNADISSYFPAIDRLAAAGYTVIRIGDPSMAPVERKGVLDLALSPKRTPLLELYFLARSRFLLGSESGPYHVCFLFGTPTLITNATDIIGSYPIRSYDRYLMKDVRDRMTGRRLGIDALLGEEHYDHFRDISRFDYLDNTPEEIDSAVEEMLEVVEGRPKRPSAAQQEFHDRCLEASIRLASIDPYVLKWGSDDGFIGRGFACRTFFARSQSQVENDIH